MTPLVLFAIFDPFTWFAIGAALLGAAVVLSFSSVIDWLRGYTNQGNTAELIKQKLASGKVSLVTNVFSSSGRKIATNQWEADKLDDELDQHFQHTNVIREAI